MELNTSFNDISVIGGVCGGRNRSTVRKPPTCRKSLTISIIYFCIDYTSPIAGFELTTFVVIATNCTVSCKSNNNKITTTTDPPNYTIYYILLWLNRN